MANKELRKLNRKELLQMLLVQCEETERMQKETEKVNAAMAAMEESYERLKEKLNEKDAKIAELQRTIEDMKMMREIEIAEAGSIAEASLRLNGIFEAAQRCADQYLENVRKLCEREKQAALENGWQQAPRRRANLSSVRREFSSSSRSVRTGTDETIVRMQKDIKDPSAYMGDIHE